MNGTWTQEQSLHHYVEQLVRYNGRVYDVRILDIVSLLTDLNDDLHHARHRDLIELTLDRIDEQVKMMRMAHT